MEFMNFLRKIGSLEVFFETEKFRQQQLIISRSLLLEPINEQLVDFYCPVKLSVPSKQHQRFNEEMEKEGVLAVIC